MDSETNLKVRQPLPETAGFGENPEKLSKFDGESWLLLPTSLVVDCRNISCC